jgi:hypothetical protein
MFGPDGTRLSSGQGALQRAHDVGWMEGNPEKSFWTGLKTTGRQRYSVMTYRCERCGFLESYAGS